MYIIYLFEQPVAMRLFAILYLNEWNLNKHTRAMYVEIRGAYFK